MESLRFSRSEWDATCAFSGAEQIPRLCDLKRGFVSVLWVRSPGLPELDSPLGPRVSHKETSRADIPAAQGPRQRWSRLLVELIPCCGPEGRFLQLKLGSPRLLVPALRAQSRGLSQNRATVLKACPLSRQLQGSLR